jgi:sugar phosphate isomerase/epimerase
VSGTPGCLNSRFDRRRFLGTAVSGIAAATAIGHPRELPAASPNPMQNRSPSRHKLGLDFFSLRSQGWTPFQLLDFAAKSGVQVGHFSEPRFLGNLEEAHLRKVRDHADRLGLEIEVGLGSICPTSTRFNKDGETAEEQLIRMFGVAKILGSPFVRCYLGSSNDRQGDTPFAQHIDNTVKTCKAVRSRAVDMNLKIAVENHAGDMQALQLKQLIEEAGKEYVGALVDAGNAAWTLEDPLHTLETLAPYALTTGVRDSAIWETETGAVVQWVPFGEGNIGIRRWAERFKELCPNTTFELEIINLRSPREFAYWKPEFWKDYRDVPAHVFAGFERIARTGKPYEKLPSGPAGADPKSPEFKQFLVDQERRDVEHDIGFCKQELGLG